MPHQLLNLPHRQLLGELGGEETTEAVKIEPALLVILAWDAGGEILVEGHDVRHGGASLFIDKQAAVGLGPLLPDRRQHAGTIGNHRQLSAFAILGDLRADVPLRLWTKGVTIAFLQEYQFLAPQTGEPVRIRATACCRQAVLSPLV